MRRERKVHEELLYIRESNNMDQYKREKCKSGVTRTIAIFHSIRGKTTPKGFRGRRARGQTTALGTLFPSAGIGSEDDCPRESVLSRTPQSLRTRR